MSVPFPCRAAAALAAVNQRHHESSSVWGRENVVALLHCADHGAGHLRVNTLVSTPAKDLDIREDPCATPSERNIL